MAHNPIQPPPSVDDLLSLGASARLGQVDFASRLVPQSARAAAPVPVVEDEPQAPTRDVRAVTPAEASVVPVILPVARLDPYADVLPSEVMPPEVPAVIAPTMRIPVEPAQSGRSPEDLGYLSLTVQEVADSAIERLRDAENATLQHLAALEVEGARRAELLTAQAELDAELIRITARREAHAIISAARVQAGTAPEKTRDARRLSEIGDAVSRFAESIEASIEPMRPNTHHPVEQS